jgi:hypothetical protein
MIELLDADYWTKIDYDKAAEVRRPVRPGDSCWRHLLMRMDR